MDLKKNHTYTLIVRRNIVNSTFTASIVKMVSFFVNNNNTLQFDKIFL